MAKTPARPAPQQARSQQRVALILDTAAALFAELGYEATTTNAIAARAGISIGSLYRYYPDKAALLRALMERYRQQMQAGFAELFNANAGETSLTVQLDRLLEMIWVVQDECPAFTYIILGADIAPEVAVATTAAEIDEETLQQLQLLLKQYAPNLSRKRARLLAMIIKAVVKSLLALSQSANPALQAQIRAEVKSLLLAYLEPALRAEAG